MDFIQVAESITELGLLGICGAVIITIFWLNYKRGTKKEDSKDEKLEEIMSKIQEQNDMLVSEIVNKINTHNLSDDENSNLTNIEREINSYLKKIQVNTNACRVALIRYHNGNRGMDGLSFLKMSMTNEIVKVGIQPMIQEFKNQFRSSLAYWCETLENGEICSLSDVDAVKDIDTTMYSFMNSRGVVAKYGIAIKNKEKTVIGFICVEYTHKLDINEDEIKKCLLDKQIKLETLLNLKN